MMAEPALLEPAETAACRGFESGLFQKPGRAGDAAREATALAAAEALASTPFFAGLSSIELARLVPELEERCYPAGAVVFSQGDRPDGLYVMRRGEARVLIHDDSRGEVLLATLRPPEYFGEMGLVSADTRSATVQAATPLEVWRLPTERFRELVAHHTSLPLEIAASLSRRLAATDRALSRTRDYAEALADEAPRSAKRPGSPPPEREQAHAGLRAERPAAPPPRAGRVPARASLSSDRLRQLPWVRALLAAAAAVLLLAAWFGPPPAGMSPEALRAMLLLMAGLAVSLLRVLPDFLTFLLMLALWVVTGIVPARVAASGFASPTWFLMLATMVLGVGLERSGLPYRAALGMLQRLPARYPVLAGSLAGLGVLLSPAMPYVAGRVSLAGPVAQDIADTLRYPARGGGTAGLALATLLGFGLMGSLFLTGSPMTLVVYGLLPPADRAEVTFVSWFLAALPLHLVMFGGMLAFILRRYRPGQDRVSERTLRVQRAVLGAVSWSEWLALTVLLVLLVGFTTQPIHGVEPAWLGLFGVAVMIAARQLDTDALRRGVNWPLLLYFGVALSLGDVFRAVELDTWLAEALVPLLAATGVQPGLLIMGVGLLALVVSLVLGMLPAMLLLVSALLPLAAQLGISPLLVGLTIITAANQWLYPQQNLVYLSLYAATEERAFTHAQARPAAIAFAALSILGLAVSIPYWHMLGLLR